jgi:Holliday junction resolvase-like predicted endonuclease
VCLREGDQFEVLVGVALSTSIQVQHELMNAVAERYRRAGYTVVAEPGSTTIPFDLGAYRPDFIAQKGDFTTIVEVKTHAQKTSFDQMRAVAEEVKRHKG